jgi:hypothetical protein
MPRQPLHRGHGRAKYVAIAETISNWRALFVSATTVKIQIGVEPQRLLRSLPFADRSNNLRCAPYSSQSSVCGQRSLGCPPAAEVLYYMGQFRGVASMLSDDETAVAFRVSGFIKSLSTSRRLETELFAASQVLAVLRAASIRLQTLLLENSFV